MLANDELIEETEEFVYDSTSLISEIGGTCNILSLLCHTQILLHRLLGTVSWIFILWIVRLLVASL